MWKQENKCPVNVKLGGTPPSNWERQINRRLSFLPVQSARPGGCERPPQPLLETGIHLIKGFYPSPGTPPWHPILMELPKEMIIAGTGYTQWHVHNSINENIRNKQGGTSLVVQWLRICLPMQGTRFDPWSGKIPPALGQLSMCATTPEPARCEPVLCNDKPPQWEAGVLQLQKPKQRRPRVTNNK